MTVGGKDCKVADIEWWLVSKGLIHDSELDADPRQGDELSGGRKGETTRFGGDSPNRMKIVRNTYDSDEDADKLW